ncbi:MAG: Orotate phosphoribosyltransferase [Parcubacteria group bacterium GW2011_GWB1_43_8]|nr:MAG: Orotate phosphoribosyltransferase [Parcubacteria group bacterium GW2011_GWB1_43_8]
MPPQENIEKFNQAYEMFRKTGAIKNGPGHFVYSSRDHGVIYIDKKEIFNNSTQTSILCEQIAEHFKCLEIDAVAGPESGGIIMANWVAMHSSRLCERKVDVIHLFKKGPLMVVGKDQEKKISGKKILLVDDIATTGSSLKKCAEIINNLEGLIVGIGLLWLRGNESIFLNLFQGIPVFPLIRARLDGWSEEQCRLIGPCSKNLPINTEFGHGAEFLKEHPEFKAVTDVPFIVGKKTPINN